MEFVRGKKEKFFFPFKKGVYKLPFGIKAHPISFNNFVCLLNLSGKLPTDLLDIIRNDSIFTFAYKETI
jgi:hypothetical protein